MYKYFLLIFFVWSTLSSSGQDAIMYHVYYDMKHVHSQRAPADTLHENMLLAAGTNSVVFTSYNKLAYGYEASGKVKKEMTISNVRGELSETRLSPARYFVPEHYLFFGQQQHVVVDYFLHPYWYESSFPEMDWQLQDEWKEILSMRCQKATTTFGGRDWEVWFSPDIPLPMGPWLLHGLPGLIIEARDSTGEVQFAATAVLPHAEDQDEVLALYLGDTIAPPYTIAEEITKKELNQLKQAARTNYQGFMVSRQDELPMLNGPRDYFNFLGVRQVHEDNPINLDDKGL